MTEFVRKQADDRAAEVDERYDQLIAACWPLFRNHQAVAARLSLMFEVYPDLAAQRLRSDPGFFGPLRENLPDLTNSRDPAYAQTALTIRERLRDFRDALQEQAEAEREPRRERRRQRDAARFRSRDITVGASDPV